MSNQKKQQEMQEAIDATLAPDAYKKMLEDMKSDTEASSEFEKLKGVDRMMRDSRANAAPRSMALSIMDRIAKKEDLPEPEPEKSTRALAWGLCISSAIVVPLLLFALLFVASVIGSGTVLGGLALGVIGSAAYLLASLNGLISFAGQLLTQFPFLFGALLLIPLAIFGLHRLGTLRVGENQ